jgi:hypothetical protein
MCAMRLMAHTHAHPVCAPSSCRTPHTAHTPHAHATPRTRSGKESATQSLAQTLTKRTDDSLKRDRLANFYVIWKLHKKANAQGVRSRPISNNMHRISNRPSLTLSSQPIDRLSERTGAGAQGLTQPDSPAGIFVILARTEYLSDLGRRCSPLPFD